MNRPINGNPADKDAMNTDSNTVAELEQRFDLLICHGASRWQAFREGNSSVGYGDTPTQAVENWRSKQRPAGCNCGVTL